MKILVVGAGVIGSIFGWCLSKSGNDVIHLVREEKIDDLRNGINLDILKVGKWNKKIVENYNLKTIIETNVCNEVYDLVIVPIKHYQIMSFLIDNISKINSSNYLLLTHCWNDFSEIEKIMKDKKFAYGDAKAGGGFSDRLLIGTIKGIDYGPVSTNECISVIDLAFKNTKIKITRHQNIKEYLMIEYAMNAGSWPIIFLERSVRKALTNPRLLYRAFRSTRECLEVVRARGVDFKEFPETNIYFATPKIKIWSMVLLMAFMFRTSEYYKRNTVHSINGREESIVFYNDLIKASSLYNIKTPMMQTYMEVMVEQNMI